MENNRTRERQKTFRAVVISVLIHVLLALLIGALIAFRPELPKPAVEEAPMELTIIEPPPAEPPKPSYVDTSTSTETDKPTENAPFESDRNTVAASQMPAKGAAPIPTQEGEDAPGLEFQNRNYTDGKPSQPSAPPSQPRPQAQPPQPTPPPQQQPTPQPTPKATPQTTPTPRPQTTPRNMGQLALLEPPKPKEQPTPRPQQQQPTQNQPPSPQSPPQPPSAPGFQPQARITRLQGNISNRGRSSAAANATPLGRYNKMVSDAIGSRWYYYVNRDMSLLVPGTLNVSFIITKSGKVENISVTRNSSNESFAACSVSAIMDAELPQIPEQLLPMLAGERVQIDFSFTILSN